MTPGVSIFNAGCWVVITQPGQARQHVWCQGTGVLRKLRQYCARTGADWNFWTGGSAILSLLDPKEKPAGAVTLQSLLEREQ